MHPAIHSKLKSKIAHNFNRAASTYDKAAFLQKEIGYRLLEHLHLIKINPLIILDLGSGTGFFANILAQIYPHAHIINLDIAQSMVSYAKQNQRSSTQAYLCADGDACPFKSRSIDLVFSNCTLHWFLDPKAIFKEIHRILKPNGLFLFSTLGPDTLRELRYSFTCIDDHPHVNTFLDMHDIGDMLLQTAFLDPVMYKENIMLTYQNVITLLHDLKLSGSQSVYPLSPTKGLSTKKTFDKLQIAYDTYRSLEGTLPATFEVLYGQGWAASVTALHQANKDGVIYVPLDDLHHL